MYYEYIQVINSTAFHISVITSLNTARKKDGPMGAVYMCSHNSWTKENIFILWLRHFIKHAKPIAETQIFLILNNHMLSTSASINLIN